MTVSRDPLTALQNFYAKRLEWSRPKTMGWQDIAPAPGAARPQGGSALSPPQSAAAPRCRAAAGVGVVYPRARRCVRLWGARTGPRRPPAHRSAKVRTEEWVPLP